MIREREARQHELELKKLELSKGGGSQPTESVKEVEVRQRIQLTHITPKFDEKHDEMGLYLINFERRAEMAQVPKKDWVAYLLAVLPAELSNMLAREEPSDANDYDFVKSLILKRYKLNSEKLKQCFYRHHKTSDKSWRNYAQELISYFNEWITELKVTTLQQLKDLIVTEQLKFRVPAEVREHFLENWLKFTSPYDLAEKLDDYESIRETFKKKEQPKRNFTNFRSENGNYHNSKFKENAKDFKPKFPVKPEIHQDGQRDKEFEKRKLARCYECGSTNHLRPQCDKFKRQETVSHIVASVSDYESMTRYTSIGKVNGIEMKILRDTGASLDLISNKYVKPYMYTNEKVWVSTPLDETSQCLPLAEVELECEMGHIITKAAVLKDSLDPGRYILGNKTAMLLEKYKTKKYVRVHMMNAIRSRALKNLEVKNEDQRQPDENLNKDVTEDKEKIQKSEEVFPVVKGISVQELLKISPKEFAEEQHKSEDLKSLITEAEKKTFKANKYVVEKNILFYKKKTKNGIERKLLVVPEKFREQIKTFCHKGKVAHLGAAKTKDVLYNTFFWPNCFSDVKKFVKTCDRCQRVGKPRDKKKEPLKIDLVTSENFPKLDVDISDYVKIPDFPQAIKTHEENINISKISAPDSQLEAVESSIKTSAEIDPMSKEILNIESSTKSKSEWLKSKSDSSFECADTKTVNLTDSGQSSFPTESESLLSTPSNVTTVEMSDDELTVTPLDVEESNKLFNVSGDKSVEEIDERSVKLLGQEPKKISSVLKTDLTRKEESLVEESQEFDIKLKNSKTEEFVNETAIPQKEDEKLQLDQKQEIEDTKLSMERKDDDEKPVQTVNASVKSEGYVTSSEPIGIDVSIVSSDYCMKLDNQSEIESVCTKEPIQSEKFELKTPYAEEKVDTEDNSSKITDIPETVDNDTDTPSHHFSTSKIPETYCDLESDHSFEEIENQHIEEEVTKTQELIQQATDIAKHDVPVTSGNISPSEEVLENADEFVSDTVPENKFETHEDDEHSLNEHFGTNKELIEKVSAAKNISVLDLTRGSLVTKNPVSYRPNFTKQSNVHRKVKHQQNAKV